MIHSKASINKIRKLLVRSGIPKGEILEEMIDHYLCEIETEIDQQTNSQQASQTIYQKIENTDFSNLKKKEKTNLSLIIAPLTILLVSIILFQWSSKKEKAVVAALDAIPKQEIQHKHEMIPPNGWPLNVSTKAITSKFGLRIHPISKAPNLHRGIDIKARMGTPVLATGDAIVKKTGYNEGAGKFIVLEHNARFSTRYFHLSSIDVKEGEFIKQGSLIGKVGSTGVSLAPHLHYELMDSMAHIDPMEYLCP